MSSWSTYFVGGKRFELATWVFDQFDVWDAHTHIGTDKDGTRFSLASLLKDMDKCRVQKFVTFPLNDPRDHDFTKPNSAVYRAFKAHPTRIVPFFRLNPHGNWKREFGRRILQGFMGIKLHPISQQFGIASPEAMEIYAAAEQHSLPVLVHTGHGLNEISGDLEKLVKEHPKLKLMLGHAAFIDVNKTIEKLANSKYVLFELSAISIFDLYTLIDKVNRKSIVFGSDEPYVSCEYALESLVHVSSMLNITMRDLGDILSGNLGKWLYEI
ncbi:MAG: amidohydrolase family protein [Candidatus Aenigmarchaeota archaeon]|nr:amidohydrolase family protein [Candidatus Aenigmarchaeota archaeon]